ncbi:TPA: RDD family protein, partial [Enterococcus faecium]
QHIGDYFSNTSVVVIRSLEAINYGQKISNSKTLNLERIK